VPIIPDDKKLLSTDVPAADVSGVSPIGAAAAQVGASLEDTGYAIKEHLKKVEAVTTAQSAAAQDKIDSEQYYKKLKLSSPDGYVYQTDDQGNPALDDQGNKLPVLDDKGEKQTIDGAYREWANERYKKNQLALPSDMAQQLYRDESGKHFTNQIALAQADQQAMLATSAHQSLADNIRKRGANRFADPNINNLMSDADDTAKDIKRVGSVIGMSNVHDTILKAHQELANQNSEGELLQIQQLVGADKKTGMPLQTPRLQNFVDEVKGYHTITDPATGKVTQIPTDHTQRRHDHNMPALSDMLSETDKYRLVEKAMSMMKGTSAHADMSSLKNDVEGLKFQYTDQVQHKPMPYLDGLRGGVEQKIVTMLKTNQHYEPSEAFKDAMTLAQAKAQGADNNPQLKLRPLEEKQKQEAKSLGYIEKEAARVADLVNAAGAGKTPVDKNTVVGIARHDYIEATHQQNTSDDKQMRENMGNFLSATQPAAIRAGTLGTVDLSKSITNQNLAGLDGWYHFVDSAKKASGPMYATSAGLPPEYQGALTKALTQQMNPADRAKMFTHLVSDTTQGGAGKSGPRIINELADKGDIPYEARFLPMFKGQPDVMEDYAQTIFSKGDVAKKYVAEYPGSVPPKGADKDSIINLVGNKFSSHIDAVVGYNPKLGGDSAKLSEGLREMIAHVAMNNFAVEHGARGSIEDYIDGAGQKILADKFYISSSGGFFGPSKNQMAVPKFYQDATGQTIGRKAYPKQLDTGNPARPHFLSEQDAQNISEMANLYRADPGRLIDKWHAVDPTAPKDSAPEQFRYFLSSRGANLREVPMIQNGRVGIGFVYNLTNRDGNSPAGTQFVQARDQKSGKVANLFIPYNSAANVGGNRKKQLEGDMKGTKSSAKEGAGF
jgi:hypothetical protein